MTDEIVVLYDRKKDEPTRWKVNTVLDEMISMSSMEAEQSKQPQSKWLKTDTDKLIPDMLFSKNYKYCFKQ